MMAAILNKPKGKDLVMHHSFGTGYITTIHHVVCYVRVDNQKMPIPFRVRDLQWDEEFKCWTLRHGFERME